MGGAGLESSDHPHGSEGLHWPGRDQPQSGQHSRGPLLRREHDRQCRGAWPVESVGVDRPSNDAQPMYAVIKDRSGREAMVSYLDGDPTATLSSAFEQWIIPLSELAPVSLSSIESVTIGGAPSGALGTAYVDLLRMGTPLPVVVDPLYADYAADPFHEGSHEGSNDWGRNTAWFTRVCIGVTVRLICFRARAQRSGTRTRNRER